MPSVESSSSATTSTLVSDQEGTRPTSPPSPTKPSPPLDQEEEELRTRLRHRRLEISHEIEEFKQRKEAEYQRFEASLRAEAAARREAKGTKDTTEGEAISTEPGAQIPINLGGSLLEDQLRDILRHATSPDCSTKAHTSPPFEKELQVAGLFAPCYLPLLEDRRTEVSPPSLLSPSAMADDPPADPGSNSSSRNSSPAAPLASSLKSSSYLDSPGGRKPKSPKRVTFQFEDETTVPSRSSPPPTKVAWSFGAIDDVDEGDYEEIEDDDDAEETFIEDVQDVEGLGVRGLASPEPDMMVPASNFSSAGHMGDFSRHQGDQLVTPTVGFEGGVVQGNDDAAPAAASQNDGSQSWTSELQDTKPTNGESTMNLSDDEDDEALFDLDEMVPEHTPQTPPHRDFSPLIEAQLAAQQLPPETGDFNLPSPSYAARVPLPGSFMPSAIEPLQFGKSPVNPALWRQNHTSSFSASFTHSPLRNNGRPVPNPAAMASSLPAAATWGFPSTSSSQDSSRFRRRSINKYIPSPPPEEETDRSSPEAVAAARMDISVFGSSLPIAITPRLSSLRSPPASTSPLNKPAATSPQLPAEESSSQLGTAHFSDSAEHLAELMAKPNVDSSEVDSYLRTARFPSAGVYRTSFAKELAQQALLSGDDVGESVVGGVDGRTGLDPESYSVRAGGGIGGLGNPRGNVWSLSARMAVEEEMERRGGSSIRG
ncbi:hypothetical protein FN846DRAFT_426297 [Sphaerosporella brunnea]|uniref:Uncharacterized protein n=1 Tax=Sphaerosporella brunnea TaxID=1250544 RepID=A0A5J5F541_9PEZI|nr:hypothetical protein FN846DRAFT_426297 [Sphaerosporella brunnea]